MCFHSMLFLFFFFAPSVCFVFIFFFVHVCLPSISNSCRKPSSWRENVIVSIPRSPSTLSRSPRSSTLTSTRLPKVRAKRQMGPSLRQLLASKSQHPQPPLRHPVQRGAATSTGRRLRSRDIGESRKSRSLSVRVLIQRMDLISAWLKMNRLKQIRPLRQRQQLLHRVRLITGSVLLS